MKENSSSPNVEARYIDGVKTRQRRAPADYSGVIEAISYPRCMYDDILLQRRGVSFGMSFRVQKASGYAIHLIYNLKIPRGDISRNQSDLSPWRWNFTTKPLEVPGGMIGAHLVIDTSDAYSWTTEALENVLYGSDSDDSRLPSPTEVYDIFEENSILQIIDHGDGTWTARGPDHVITMLDSTTFKINWPSAVYISSDTYKISSL